MFNWHEVPFVRLLCPFLAGIFSAFYFNHENPDDHWILAGVVFSLFLSSRLLNSHRYRWLYGALLNMALWAAGYGAAWQHNELNASTHFAKLGLPENSAIVGRIAAAPVKKEDWIKVEFKVIKAGLAAANLRASSGNVLLYLAKDSMAEELAYGDVLALSCRLTQVEPPKNPHAFDYGRYLHFKNTHHQAFVRAGDWKLLERGRGNWFMAAAISLRDRFLKTLRKHLDSENELAVGSALILGYRDEVPEEILTAYSQTGAVHVLAVSGLHVGIVFLFLNFFLKRIKRKGTLWVVGKVLIVLLAIWAFALVTGASPSVLRAAVMFSFVNIGQVLRRRANVYNTLAASAFCLLLYDPYWLASVSFQLSYLAVLGIVFFQPRLQKLWKVDNKAVFYLWQLVCVSLGAQLMTLPLTLFYFHQFPTYFWLSGLVLVPLSGVVLGAGLSLFFLEAFFPGLAIWLGEGLCFLIWFCNKSIFAIQQLPAAVFEGISIGAGVSLLLYLALSGAMISIIFKKFGWLIMAMSVLVITGVGYSFKDYQDFRHGQIAVYNIYKHTAIDFFDGGQVYSLIGEGLEERPLSFAAEGHRVAMGAGRINTFQLADTTSRTFRRWLFQKGFAQFYDTRLAILDKLPGPPPDGKTKVDYVVLRGSPKLEMEALAAVFEFRQVIFDASNKKWQVGDWKQACERLGIAYYDVATDGAFVLDLKTGEVGW